MAILVKTDGTRKEVLPKEGKIFTLKELQGYVGGYIEIHPFEDKMVVMNEEGRIYGLPLNEEAVKMTGVDLVGDILFCEKGEIE